MKWRDIMKKKYTLALIVLILFSCSAFVFAPSASAATKMYNLGRVNTKSAYIYKTSSTKSKKLIKAKKYTNVVATRLFMKSGTAWYRVRFLKKVNGKDKSYYGYIPKRKITLGNCTTPSKYSYSGTTKSKVYLKAIAAVPSGSVIKIPANAKIKVIARVTVGNNKWYKCTYKKKTGYLLRDTVKTVDITFEEKLKSFPGSYRSKLRSLHAKYPKWEFKPVNTGLYWSTVLNEESVAGICKIESNPANSVDKANQYWAPVSYLSTDKSCYDWSTNTFTSKDGKGPAAFYSASKGVIGYYLDPRNFLTEKYVFQFNSFKYNGNETSSVVTNMLKGTFMSGNYSYIDPDTHKSVTRNYANSFITAGKYANISPYFLAARARQEQGVTARGSVTGTYPGLTGLYNYFNIGANDSSEGKAIENGLNFAKGVNKTKEFTAKYLLPWNSPYKSIRGGALYLSQGYIPVGQFTTYFQKFNVVNVKGPLYRHQFMSNVQAPCSESQTNFNTYNNYNVISSKFTFYIPVYKNMPSSTSLPAKRGNPNPYLKNLVVTADGTQIFKSNDYSDYNKKDYTWTLSSESPSKVVIKIIPTTLSNFTKVTFLNEQEVTINKGSSQTIKFVTRSESGATYTYSVTIKN